MAKKLTSNVLRGLIREAIEEFDNEQMAMNGEEDVISINPEDYPEEYEEFKSQLGQDYSGYDFPMDDEEEMRQFGLFMKENYPEKYEEASMGQGGNETEIMNEAQLKRVVAEAAKRVIANLYPGDKIKKNKKH